MKIRNVNIPKLYMLSAKEMDLFLYLCKHMNQATGYVEGVYYREVMKHARMCKQSFYNALKGLEAKGIVKVYKLSPIDYNVLILDNEFPTRESFHSYVNLNHKAFRSKKFWALKVHEKYMLLEFLKRTKENKGHIIKGTQKLYDEFMGILGVTKRVIRSYLHNLKEFFYIGIQKGNYCIAYHKDVFDDKLHKMDQKSEEDWCFEHLVKKECFRNHITYDRENLKDTAFLIKQYRGFCDGGTSEAIPILMLCIQTSIKETEPKERRLQQKYIHKLMRRALGLPESAPQE